MPSATTRRRPNSPASAPDRVADPVYAVAGLICAIAGWSAIGRVGADVARRLFEGNAAIDHRSRDRRHLAVRRARLHPRATGERADRRRVPVGLRIAGVDVVVAAVCDRLADHRRRRRRPMDPEGLGHEHVSPPVLSARNLMKRYGRVVAIDNPGSISCRVRSWRVIGDNGAGKSSLIKALSGAIRPDSGEVRLDGKPVTFASPIEARRAGLETVYQTLRCRRRCRSATTCSSAARSTAPQHLRQAVPPARSPSDGRYRPRRSCPSSGCMTIQNIQQPVETLSRRPAPGRGGGAGLSLRQQGHHHGQADGGAGRQGITPRFWTSSLKVEARGVPIVLISRTLRTSSRCLPHPYPPARPAGGGDLAEGLLDVGCRRHHDRRAGAAVWP